ncbi:P-loop containing nucleoside triphosphate hydrolase protein [Phaeosphaeriaceae sp. SRC1lsM3a]|nr:P-loop containing nucleoside triphosphate hydrolase protein [Stagonospora sp. SRC1lsM3a]
MGAFGEPRGLLATSGRQVRLPSGKSRSSSSPTSSAAHLLELMNSSILDNISEKVTSMTRGRLDIRLFIAACVGVKAAANTVPAVLEMMFDQMKTNVSSSLAVSQNDHKLHDGLRWLAQDSAEASGKAWYQFSGEHGVQLENGDIGNCPGKTQKFFRHDGTLFILEMDEFDVAQPVRNTSQIITSQMVVRCFGRSNAPIRALFEYVIQQHNESEKLTCLKVVAGCQDVSSTSNKRPLSTIDLEPLLKDYITRDVELFFGEDSPDFYENTGQPYRRGYLLYGPPGTGKTSVSLSGLLNVIDGADAAEGRLLIMTTNCPEKLDPALLRAGRCDEKFKIDYATKTTAQLTFKRIFGFDEQTPYKPATIDRFADAFVAQFPSRSKICTAELAKYLGQYRGRPQKAIEDFANWVKMGNDLFAYRVEDLASDGAEGEYNVPEAFEPAFLNVGPEDLVEIKSKSKGFAAEVALAHSEGHSQLSSWNPFRWGRKPQSDEAVSIPPRNLRPAGHARNRALVPRRLHTVSTPSPSASWARL